MIQALEVLAILLVAVGVALTLAHALEYPGKLRLDRENYFAVQGIYYPGFTIGGFFGEIGAMLSVLALAIATPMGTPASWATLVAFLLLVAMHGVYWTVTHPVNKVWTKPLQTKGAGAAFFGVGADAPLDETDWTLLRDRWERSHVARAVLALLSLAALAIAVSSRS